MSFNQSLPPNASNFLPPPGTNFLVVVDSAIPFLMIGATMGTALVVMLLALVFFSTASMRRKPVFILNVIAIFSGILDAILNVYEEIHTLKSPLEPLDSRFMIVMGALNAVTPTFVDSILLLRLYSVFPPRTTPRLQFITIMGISILLKIARLINVSYFLEKYAQNLHALVNTSTAAGGAMVLITSPLPNIKIEWVLQVFDNVYSSSFFLYRVYRQSASSRFSLEQSVSQKLTTLFWISTSNFVFPVMLGIVQIVIYMAKPKEYLLALYVEEVNFHFNIIGVVFATVWVAHGRWVEARYTNKSSQALSSIRFNSSLGDRKDQTRTIEFVPSPQPSMSQSILDISSRASGMDRVEEYGNAEKKIDW